MRFVAIEFDNNVNNTHVLGYLRIPESIPPIWSNGFRDYLCNVYKASSISIYPLNIHLDSQTMGKAPAGYTNMEDDFLLSLRSDKYYEPSVNTNAIRRSWAKLDPMSTDFVMKER